MQKRKGLWGNPIAKAIPREQKKPVSGGKTGFRVLKQRKLDGLLAQYRGDVVH